MNQALIFNNDIDFDTRQDAWRCTALLSGERITIYFHSMQLKRLDKIDTCTKYDLEEIAELWLEKNEPDGDTIHIKMR
jgi:hypothetical protein